MKSLRVMQVVFAFGAAVALFLILSSCVQGTPTGPGDVPQQSELGKRTVPVRVKIENPQAPDTTEVTP